MTDLPTREYVTRYAAVMMPHHDPGIFAVLRAYAEGRLVEAGPVKTEYRLVVDKGYHVGRYLKRDAEHAEKGVKDAIRDAGRHPEHQDIYIETRTITEWERTK